MPLSAGSVAGTGLQRVSVRPGTGTGRETGARSSGRQRLPAPGAAGGNTEAGTLS